MVMAIRRQAKRRPPAISLARLLEELAQSSHLINRDHWNSILADSYIAHRSDAMFDDLIGVGQAQLSGDAVERDLKALDEVVASCVRVADKRIAHYDERPVMRGPTCDELHAALDNMVALVKKYYLLITAVEIGDIAVPSDNWQAIFDVAWRKSEGTVSARSTADKNRLIDTPAFPAPPMIATPTLRLPALNAWVRTVVAPLARQGKTAKTRFISRLLTDSYLLRHLHRSPHITFVLLHPSALTDPYVFASAYSSRDLRDHLGGAHAPYMTYLTPFWHFDPSNYGYSKFGGITKPYVLNAITIAKLDELWGNSNPGEVIDRDTGVPLSSAALPFNGVCKTSYSQITIRPLVTFDRAHVNAVIHRQEAAVPGNLGLRRQRVLALRFLYVIRKWLLTFGGVPNLYRDYDTLPADGNGRLTGIGGLSLQTIPRGARRLLYSGLGWWDFDFQSCHLSILHSLCNGLKLNTPALDDYMGDKAGADALLADELEVPVKRMKRVMNALLYGQSIANNPHSSLYDLIGTDAIDQLQLSIYYRWLKDELTHVRKQIIAAHQLGDVIRNAVGKELATEGIDPKTGKVKRLSNARLLSHILTGYEAWALDLVCRDQDDLVVLMHDGWVAERDRDVTLPEQLIHQESTKHLMTPLTLRIKMEQYI